MELRVNDYVRYKYENYIYIGKIKFISEVMSGLDETLQLDIDNCMEEILKEDIIKSSPNIIDLIEVGDYVNGSYVEGFIKENKFQNKLIITEAGMIDNNDVKTIATREQFKNIEYEVK